MELKTAFSTLACPEWSWPELLANTARYGFEGIEVRLLRGETDLLKLDEFQPSQLAARRADLAAHGVAICGLSSSVRFDFAERAVLAEQHGIGRRYIDLAHELGAGFVRVFGDVLPPESDAAGRSRVFSQIVEGLGRLGAAAAGSGVQILMETHGDFAQSHLMRQVMGQVAQPSVGVLWDTHHPWRFYGEELAATWANLRPWVRHTHWKDSITRTAAALTPEMKAAEERASRLMSGHRPADYVLFGDGEFPAEKCLQLLQGAGYDGWHSLEWEKAWHPQLEPAEVALPLFRRRLGELFKAASNR
jgi:sugar phosphate isomerase/epimerase